LRHVAKFLRARRSICCSNAVFIWRVFGVLPWKSLSCCDTLEVRWEISRCNRKWKCRLGKRLCQQNQLILSYFVKLNNESNLRARRSCSELLVTTGRSLGSRRYLS